MNEFDEIVRSLAAPSEAGEASMLEETQNRIREHRLQSLENVVPLQAALGVMAADLFVSGTFTAKIRRDEFTAGSTSLDELGALAAVPLDLQIRLAKQIVQLTQLSRQIARDDNVKADAKHRSKAR